MIAVSGLDGVLSGVIVILLSAGLVGGWKVLRSQNDKLNRITNYLFQAKTGKDGIPAPLGKIAEMDTKIDGLQQGQRTIHTVLTAQSKQNVEILKRLEMSNGTTIAQAVEAMTTDDPAHNASTPPIDISGSDNA